MKVLLIEDDDIDASKMTTGLGHKGVDVRRCKSIRQFKKGWFELGKDELSLMQMMGVPETARERVLDIFGVAFHEEAALKHVVAPLLGNELDAQYYETIRDCMAQAAFDSRFDCILLDLAMPEDGYYTKTQSENGTVTGLCLLEDIAERVHDTPIIIVTIMKREELTEKIKRQFPGVVRHIIFKPTTSSFVMKTIQRYVGKVET